ncbi:Axonemal 84 kDa protein [Diplonema papillatum]|nr:Axonemal 84 kDa protein [Diplonema papillatum]
MPSKAKQQKKLEEEMRRKEELQKKAQEAADKLFKQHERERAATEKSDKGKREAEQLMTLAERERLQSEKTVYSAIGSDKEHRIGLALREYQKYQSWQAIVSDSWLPDVMRESDINSFLTTWREDDNSAGEDSKRNLEEDFKMIKQAFDLIQCIYNARDEACVQEAKGDRKGRALVAFHRSSLLKVSALVLEKLDDLTANMLQFLDKYVDRDDDQGITLCQENEALRYGMWAGDRRPRHRGIDYREIGVSISPKEGSFLPKPLDLVKERGMRVMQLNFDPLSLLNEDPLSGCQYYALNCVLFVELLQYPKLPIQVKEWTLRHETSLANDLRRHPYPPTHPGADLDGAKPVRISFVVPPRIVVRHLAPLIGLWNQEEKTWGMVGTSDFDYKKDTRTATFATQHLACCAIIQEKGFDVPYEEWSVVPLSEDEVLYSIEGRRRGEISDREVKILIRNNLCQVLAPDEPELEYLRTDWYSPAALLRHLSASGYNFMFTDADADYFPDVLPKARIMELPTYNDLANFCTVYAFASSKHNAARPGLQPGVTCEDPNMTLFRMSKEMRPRDSTTPFHPENVDGNWHTIRYSAGSCCFTQCKESADFADITAAEDHVSHLNLLMTRSARSDESQTNEIRRRYDNGNPLLHSAVYEILALTRPLSFG